MIDYTLDIIFYERSRQEVRDLKKQYAELYRNCHGIREELKPYCSQETIDYGNCLNAVHEARPKIISENSGEYYSFDEILGNDGCENCNKAWDLRCGDLAKAKQRFGEAKRNLARVGKKLISRKLD